VTSEPFQLSFPLDQTSGKASEHTRHWSCSKNLIKVFFIIKAFWKRNFTCRYDFSENQLRVNNTHQSFVMRVTPENVADSENQIKIGHRNLESQQNDNIPWSDGETSLKHEKLQKRSKSTKCYIHFHNFPESSAKNFNVVSHLQVSQIPKTKSNRAPELGIPAE